MNDIRLGISQSRGYKKEQLSSSRSYRNLFMKYKLNLKSHYQLIFNTRYQIESVQGIIQKLEDKRVELLNNKVLDFDTSLTLSQEIITHQDTWLELENSIPETERKIEQLECGMFELVELGDKFLSTHQKIQLLGGGVAQAMKVIEYDLKKERALSAEDVPFMDLVMHHTEYQRNKQRECDFIDCEDWEMPVFQACMNESLRRMIAHREQTGRCFMTEFLEDHAKEQGKKVVQTPTEYGTLMTFEDDINAKYERDGKVITLNSTTNSKA